MNAKSSKTHPLPGRGLEKRPQIIAYATEMFLKCGYKDTSMDQLALVSKLSKPTIYHYFPKKEKLFEAVLDELCSHFLSEMPRGENQDDPVQALRDFTVYLATVFNTEHTVALYRLIVAQCEQTPKIAMTFNLKIKQPIMVYLVEMFVRIEQKERIAIGDKAQAVDDLFGMVREHFLWPLLLSYRPPLSQEAVLARVERIFENFRRLFLQTH